MMVALDEAAVLVSGCYHTTGQAAVRPCPTADQDHNDAQSVWSVGIFMLYRKQVVVYGDCAIDPDPKPGAAGRTLPSSRAQSAESIRH